MKYLNILFIASILLAQNQAPVSIINNHLHKKGEWMFGYRYMYMDMGAHKMDQQMHKVHGEHHHPDDEHFEHDSNDSNSGHEDEVHDEDPHGNEDNNHHSMPHKHTMTMQMSMLEAMYGVTDDLNLMVMTNFIQNTMNHGDGFKTRNEGWGDTSLTALYRIFGDCHEEGLIGGIGLSFPTGDVKAKDNYHSGESHHPYHMVIGSGTYDLLPSLTYVKSNMNFFWGVQGSAVIRLGRNSQEYSFGDNYKTHVWIGKELSKGVFLTTRLGGDFNADVDGRDKTIKNTGVMWDPKEQGYQILEAGLGLNFALSSSTNLGVEFIAPLAQNIDDGVHERKWGFTVGVLSSF